MQIHPINQSARIEAEIKIPGDKSISHRSVIVSAISLGQSEITNFLNGDDCLNTLKAFEQLGLAYTHSENYIRIQGLGLKNLMPPINPEIDLGNSGTGIRLLTGLFSGLNFCTKLTGDLSLRKRPMMRVIKPLSSMGAEIESCDGKAPLVINPESKAIELCPIHYESPIASAQVKSAILLAGLHADGITTVTEPEKSRDHLERMLEYFGASIKISANQVSINGRESLNQLSGRQIFVPSDISSAAFFMVAAAILENSKIIMHNIGINPTRKGILEVFDKMGVKYQILNSRIENNEAIASLVVESSSIKATIIEGDIIPRLIDEIPIIAILAAQASGTTIIKDASELKVKESNRIATTINMLSKLGVKAQETEDGMIIEGRSSSRFEVVDPVIDSHGDHRLAMASAIAALYSTKSINILQTEFVSTSFPNFFDLLKVFDVRSSV